MIARLRLIDNDTKSPNSSNSMRPVVVYRTQNSVQTLRQISTALSSRCRLHCWAEIRASSPTSFEADLRRGLLLSVGVGFAVAVAVPAAVLVVPLVAEVEESFPLKPPLRLV